MRAVYILAVLVLFFGCVDLEGTTPLEELGANPEAYVGKEITVKGIVENSFKLGQLSGYKLSEGNTTISVSSKSLPEEGKEMTVTGTWMKDTIFGYYLLAKSE